MNGITYSASGAWQRFGRVPLMQLLPQIQFESSCNDNHHEGINSLRLLLHRFINGDLSSPLAMNLNAQPSFPWISSNPSTDLMIPRRTKEKIMKPSSSSSSLLTSLCDDLIIFFIHFIFGGFSIKSSVLKEKDEMLRGGG
ncbi:unnamed protein product [Brassica napus]|nr:unnamed protein product [Brassica napus]